jgi:endonuclease/exonuclease/phosphatase family metal-dependent hydrolase
MKKSIAALITISCLLTACIQEKPTERLNVLSFNIRLNLASDGDNQWSNRKDYAIDMIRFYDADIFGAQEVLHDQLNDMLNGLPEFGYIGVGRDDGATKGEYIPILYRKDKFELLDGGNFWLAEEVNTPGVKGWDAAYVRVTSWGIFKSKTTGDEFFFMNTHLDNEGQVARREGASLIL